MHAKGIIISLVVFTCLLAVGLYWEHIQPVDIGPQPVHQQAKSQGLGADIYQKSTNPASSDIPESNAIKASVTNPFDTYKNPFESR